MESRHTRYRKQRARRERDTEVFINTLKGKIARHVEYLGLFSRATLLCPERHIHYRRAILEYYTDMFDCGVNSLDPAKTEKQLMLLRYHLADDCVIERVGVLLPCFIMKVLEIYTMLYRQLSIQLVSIEGLDPEQTSLLLVQQVSMIITQRSIHFLMPHILQNQELTKQILGQMLTMRLQYHIRFDDQNRIVYVNIEHQIAQGWFDMIKDTALVNLAIRQMKQVDSEFIRNNYEQLMNDSKLFKLAMV